MPRRYRQAGLVFNGQGCAGTGIRRKVSKAGRYQLVVVDEAGNSDRIEFRLENPPEGVVSARILTASVMVPMPSVDCRFPGRGGESGFDLPSRVKKCRLFALVEVALLDGMKHQVALWVTPLRWWIIAMAGKPVPRRAW